MDNSTRSRIAGHETNLVRLRRKFSSVTKLPGTVTKLVRKLSKSKIGQASEKFTMPTPGENEKQMKWSYTRREEKESVYASTETLTESLSSDDDESGVEMKMSSGSELDNEVNGILDRTITQDLPEKRHSDTDVMTDCEVGESISHTVCPNMPNACTKPHFHVNINDCDHTSESSQSLGSAKSDPTGTCSSVSKNEDLKNLLGKSMELEISSFKRRITKYEWLGKDVTRKEHVSKSEPLLSPSKPQNKEVSVQTDEASEGKESVGNGLEHGGEYIRLLREYDSAGSSSSSRSQSPDLQLVQAVCESSWKNKIISPPRRTQIHFKVLVVGDKKVGKTSILDRHISNSFSDLYQPSSGVNFANEVISWNEESDLHVVYCDIAGEGSLGEMANIYTFAHAVIVVHDATSRLKKLCRNMAKWSEWLKDRDVHSILLINKCDEADVDNLKVDDLCSIFGFSAWYKTSAKKNINIESAFYSVLTKMVATDARLDKQEENPQLVYRHKCC